MSALPVTTDEELALPDLAELAAVSRKFETAPATTVIEWAWDRFGPEVALASSFQDCVLLDQIGRASCRERV